MARTLRLRALIWFRWLVHTRAVWLRGLLCWAVGLTVVLVDSSDKFDLRFQLRGRQVKDSKIVLIYIQQNDWFDLNVADHNLLRPLKEIGAITDSFFWNAQAWQKLLSAVLKGNPLAVASTFFFPVGSIGPPPPQRDYPSLYDPRIIWAARLDSDGRAIMPAFTSTYGHNAGLIDLFTDEDRNVRRFSSPLIQVPHLALRLATAATHHRYDMTPYSFADQESYLINFQGREGSYTVIHAQDLIRHPERAQEWLDGRIAIIGTQDLDNHLHSTPVGPLSRAEIVANLTDNILGQRWLHKISLSWIAIFLGVLVILASGILQLYPQAVAFVFLVWIGIGISTISIWFFDRHFLWIPILAPLVVLAVTYIVFVAYQLTLQENINWRLEEEKRYLQEIEQLKNNFVSLFSHDLKTPIAKIQAICDRLLSAQPAPEVQHGLQSLRQESSELHRYIQSILRVSRIESSDFKINKEPSDINELIVKVILQLRPLAEAKQIKLSTNLEPMFAIEIDSALIQEVILNLAENAIKYSPEGGTVEISSREVGDRVIVTVTDSGQGIPAEEQNRIFEKFYRSHAHTLSTKGSGLGLYLVKYFVELHGGRVFVRSTPNKGTRIGFALPLVENIILETVTTEKKNDPHFNEHFESINS